MHRGDVGSQILYSGQSLRLVVSSEPAHEDAAVYTCLHATSEEEPHHNAAACDAEKQQTSGALASVIDHGACAMWSDSGMCVFEFVADWCIYCAQPCVCFGCSLSDPKLLTLRHLCTRLQLLFLSSSCLAGADGGSRISALPHLVEFVVAHLLQCDSELAAQFNEHFLPLCGSRHRRRGLIRRCCKHADLAAGARIIVWHARCALSCARWLPCVGWCIKKRIGDVCCRSVIALVRAYSQALDDSTRLHLSSHCLIPVGCKGSRSNVA